MHLLTVLSTVGTPRFRVGGQIAHGHNPLTSTFAGRSLVFYQGTYRTMSRETPGLKWPDRRFDG
jgi:hypothetical protein